MTPSEELLWDRLRGRAFETHKFRRQHPIGPWVLDLFCAELQLAIEIDGPIHLGQKEDDLTRQEAIEGLGIRFLRISARLVEENPERAISLLRAAIRLRETEKDIR